MTGSVTRLAAAWCTLFVVGTDLFVVSPLLPSIAGQFGLTHGAAGISVTVFAIVYMLSAPLLGQIADRVGRRRMLCICLCGFAAANLLTAASPNFTCLLAARIAAGALTAGVSPSVYALVGESAPPARRATWMAIAVSGLLCSLCFGAPLGELVGAAFGWPKDFDLLAGLSLVLVLANRRIWPADSTPAAAAMPGPALTAALAPRLLPTVVWATGLYAMYIYLGAWLTRLGFAPEAIAQVILCYGIGALAGTLGGGRIADRLGPRTATCVSLLGLSAAFTLLPLALPSGVAGIALGLGLLSAVAQVFFPAQQAGLVGDFPSRRATVLAWNSSSLFFGIALGSLVGGRLVAYGSFEASLLVCAAITLGGLAINWMVAPRPVVQRG